MRVINIKYLIVMNDLELLLLSPSGIGGLSIGGVLLIGIFIYLLIKKKKAEEERERKKEARAKKREERRQKELESKRTNITINNIH